MKRRFTKYPSGYVRASSDVPGRWQVYYYEPIFVDRYNPNDNWSDYSYSRVPEGSGRYAVYNGKQVVVGTFDTEAEAERKCRWGMEDSYPDGTPFTVDFNYEQI